MKARIKWIPAPLLGTPTATATATWRAAIEHKAIEWRTKAVQKNGERDTPPLEYFIARLTHGRARYRTWYTIYEGTPETPNALD